MSLFNAYMALSGAFDASVERDVPLARRTSLRVGGPAALLLEVQSFVALRRSLEILGREAIDWVVLGKGTNVLAADEGFEGCVIVLGRDFSHVSVEGTSITAGAALSLAKLVNVAYGHGLGGLSPMVGIPGTVGGAIAMDAGTRHEWIGPRVSSVVCLDAERGLQRHQGSSIEWGYRHTSLPADQIILEVTLDLEETPKAELARDMDRRLSRRRRTQPTARATCGSCFRNPPDGSAGELVERCGLKGLGCGGAKVSEVHGNFIENDGTATADDVLHLLHTMRDTVRGSTGVELQPEVRFLGFRG